jgi:hypothetical protein
MVVLDEAERKRQLLAQRIRMLRERGLIGGRRGGAAAAGGGAGGAAGGEGGEGAPAAERDAKGRLLPSGEGETDFGADAEVALLPRGRRSGAMLNAADAEAFAGRWKPRKPR